MRRILSEDPARFILPDRRTMIDEKMMNEEEMMRRRNTLAPADYTVASKRPAFMLLPPPHHESGEVSAVVLLGMNDLAVARKTLYSVSKGRPFMDLSIETTIMYGMMEDAQDDRSLLRVRVKLLYRDRSVHRRLAVMIERGARMAREAWGLSMDTSDYAHSDVMSLRTTIVGQRALILELQSVDHRRQGRFKENDHRETTRSPRCNTQHQSQTLIPQHLTPKANFRQYIDAGDTAAQQHEINQNGDERPYSGSVPEGLCK
ncbi:hypothetical protein Tco_1456917 [Tanacetum coccineum]